MVAGTAFLAAGQEQNQWLGQCFSTRVQRNFTVPRVTAGASIETDRNSKPQFSMQLQQ